MTEEKQNNETVIIKTDTDSKIGQDKCPKCGYSENASFVYPNNVFRRID